MFISFEKPSDAGLVTVNTDHVASAFVDKDADGQFVGRIGFGGANATDPVVVYVGPDDMSDEELSGREQGFQNRIAGRSDKPTWTKADDASYRSLGSKLRP